MHDANVDKHQIDFNEPNAFVARHKGVYIDKMLVRAKRSMHWF